jgi:hypothetical protein
MFTAGWALTFIIFFIKSNQSLLNVQMFATRALGREGQKSSCRKFGLWADFERLRHVLCWEGMRAWEQISIKAFFYCCFIIKSIY